MGDTRVPKAPGQIIHYSSCFHGNSSKIVLLTIPKGQVGTYGSPNLHKNYFLGLQTSLKVCNSRNTEENMQGTC